MNVPASSGAVEKRAHVWERDPLDHYIEPRRATEQLLRVETFDGPVLDPCCGIGNIVVTLLAAGLDACGTDIVCRVGEEEFPETWPGWFAGSGDFLKTTNIDPYLNIVMNPPFFRAKGAEAFIRKALSLGLEKLAVFVDIRFLAGARRAEGLFRDHPPSRVWIITPRVSCPPGAYLASGGTAGNGSSDWCWLVWDRSAEPRSSIGWLTLADLSSCGEVRAR